MNDFWVEIGYPRTPAISDSVRWRKFHLSTKTGPNGHALWMSVKDFINLPESLYESIRFLGGFKLSHLMEVLKNNLNSIARFFQYDDRINRIRKISAIPAPEGKTRMVAILDYWSQTVLYPLHQYLFRAIKKIPQDCTFNQGSFIEKLKPNKGQMFWSVDLTAATDRFPIEVIEKLIAARLTDNYAKHWRNIMVGYPYWTKEKGYITYSVGNPMGAYSSWNSFALTHHYIVYYCCRTLGINWKKCPYVLLGDDIVINDDKVAKLYMNVMNLLGVKFSSTKTYTSPFSYEFAMRFIWDGKEITPLPIGGLYQVRNSLYQLISFLCTELQKGWTMQMEIPSLISELYGHLNRPARYRAVTEEIVYIAHQVMMVVWGKVTATQGLEPVLVKLKPKLKSYFDKAINKEGRDPYFGLLKSCVMILFTQSVEPHDNDKPLGLLAESLVMYITSLDIKEAHSTLIGAIPILGVYGQVEEKYLKISREVYDIDTIYGGEWKLGLKTLAIPLSDQVFYVRNQDLLPQASCKLVKVLKSNLDQLEAYPQMI